MGESLEELREELGLFLAALDQPVLEEGTEGERKVLRDDLSRKLMTTSHEEQHRYIKEQLEAEPGPPEQGPRHRSTV